MSFTGASVVATLVRCGRVSMVLACNEGRLQRPHSSVAAMGISVTLGGHGVGYIPQAIWNHPGRIAASRPSPGGGLPRAPQHYLNETDFAGIVFYLKDSN